jgi:predicted enzyme related to lactoylglutathione lyase
VFFRARDPKALAGWYAEVMGVPAGEEGYGIISYKEGQTLVWSVFPEDTNYFGRSEQASMINYRVDDLDGMLERLRAAGANVDDRTEAQEFGRFGWATDPEGNRFELWEPGPGI